jgi:hypothetical protein
MNTKFVINFAQYQIHIGIIFGKTYILELDNIKKQDSSEPTMLV